MDNLPNRLHTPMLAARLEEALSRGCAYISWDEFYLWYNADRVGVAMRRDFKERWEELHEVFESMTRFNDKMPRGALLYIPNGDDGFFILGASSLCTFEGDTWLSELDDDQLKALFPKRRKKK
jgi:hypothetical protein